MLSSTFDKNVCLFTLSMYFVRILKFVLIVIKLVCCRDLQRATHDFSTTIGKGGFGHVYKAQMATGETVAVKVLDTNSSQGEMEFSAEVL